jgi:hypothetical protein
METTEHKPINKNPEAKDKSEVVIEIKGLKKSFGNKEVLKGYQPGSTSWRKRGGTGPFGPGEIGYYTMPGWFAYARRRQTLMY